MLRKAGFSRWVRVKELGRANVTGLARELAQYGMRWLGRSTELRYVAWK
jgi:hypothetical protein